MVLPYGPSTAADVADQHATGNIFATGRHPHPSALLRSDDGIDWEWLGDALTPGKPGSWDCNVARASAWIESEGRQWLFYDGRTGRGDIYEDQAGLAVSEDGRQWRKITVDAPALSGAGQTSCYRYQSLVRARGDLWAYYETSRRDGSHELRGIRLIGRGQD